MTDVSGPGRLGSGDRPLPHGAPWRSPIHGLLWSVAALLLMSSTAHAGFVVYILLYQPRSTSLLVVDGATGDVRKRVRLGRFSQPFSNGTNRWFATSDRRRLYAYLEPNLCPPAAGPGRDVHSRCILAIDVDGHRVIKAIPVLGGLDVATLDRSGSTAFVDVVPSQPGAVDVAAIDLVSGTSRLFTLPDPASETPGIGVTRDLFPLPDTQRVALVRDVTIPNSADAFAQLLVFDGTTGSVVDELRLPPLDPSSLFSLLVLPLPGNRVLLGEAQLDAADFASSGILLRLYDLQARREIAQARVPGFLGSSTTSFDGATLFGASFLLPVPLAVNVTPGPSFGQARVLDALIGSADLRLSPVDPRLLIGVAIGSSGAPVLPGLVPSPGLGSGRIVVFDPEADEVLREVPLSFADFSSPASAFVAGIGVSCPAGDHTCYCRSDTDCDDGDACTIDACERGKGCSYRAPSCLEAARCALRDAAGDPAVLENTPCRRAAQRAARMNARASRTLARLDTATPADAGRLLRRGISLVKRAAAASLRIRLSRRRTTNPIRASFSATCADTLLIPQIESIRRLRALRRTLATCLSEVQGR